MALIFDDCDKLHLFPLCKSQFLQCSFIIAFHPYWKLGGLPNISKRYSSICMEIRTDGGIVPVQEKIIIGIITALTNLH